MTVRIFGTDEIVRIKKIKRPRSWQDNLLTKKADKKTRLCKSVESLQIDKKSGSSQRKFFQKFPKTSFKILRKSFSMESEEKHLEVSSNGSPASSLSPTTPDHFTALQSGLGHRLKERSSSIATTGTGTQQTTFPMRWKFKPRRFSDSQFSRRKILRVFLKDKKVIMIV